MISGKEYTVMASKDIGLKTVLSSIAVLEFLGEENKPVRLTDISNALGMPKSRIYRILSTLTHKHYVWQDTSSRRYELGHRIYLLGQQASGTRSMLEIIRPEMIELGQQVEETVLTAVIEDNEVLNLFIIPGPHPVTAFLKVGTRAPIHATATGKSLAVHFDDDFIDQIFKGGVEKHTPYTISNSDMFKLEIDKTKSRGYAVSIDEWVVGLSAVSSAIVDPYRVSPFGLTIIFPTGRVADHRIKELGELTKIMVDNISQKLIY